MPKVRIYQVDAFTAEPFRGNPAAVVTHAAGLTEEQMADIAREMNLSATAFVRPPRDPKANFQVRFLTPIAEENLCGHATIAAFHVLAQEARILFDSPVVTQYQETRAGVLPVELFVHRGEIHRVLMTQTLPTYREPRFATEEVAAVLGIDAHELRSDLPIEIVSTGMPQLFVPVKSLDSLSKLKPDYFGLAEMNLDQGAVSTHVFALEGRYAGSCASARHFAPVIGITEDSATGTAAGGLGCYLVRHGVHAPGDMVMEQGRELGRPASLFVEIRGTKEQINSVKVGGRAVTVMEGEITV